MNRLSQLTSALVRMVCPWLATGAGFVGLGAAQGNADVRCEWKHQGICEEQIVRFLCGLARTLDLGWSWHATIIVIIAPWLSLTGSLPLPQLDSRYEPQKLRKAIYMIWAVRHHDQQVLLACSRQKSLAVSREGFYNVQISLLDVVPTFFNDRLSSHCTFALPPLSWSKFDPSESVAKTPQQWADGVDSLVRSVTWEEGRLFQRGLINSLLPEKACNPLGSYGWNLPFPRSPCLSSPDPFRPISAIHYTRNSYACIGPRKRSPFMLRHQRNLHQGPRPTLP